MEVHLKEIEELRGVVIEWLKDALGPGADFREMGVEMVAEDEFYFYRAKDNKGKQYNFRVFRRFDENGKLNLEVIDDDSGLRITSPERC